MVAPEVILLNRWRNDADWTCVLFSERVVNVWNSLDDQSVNCQPHHWILLTAISQDLEHSRLVTANEHSELQPLMPTKQRIRGSTRMRHINGRFACLLTYLFIYSVKQPLLVSRLCILLMVTLLVGRCSQTRQEDLWQNFLTEFYVDYVVTLCLRDDRDLVTPATSVWSIIPSQFAMFTCICSH